MTVKVLTVRRRQGAASDLKSVQSRVLGCSYELRIQFQIDEKRSQQDQNEDRSLGIVSLDLD